MVDDGHPVAEAASPVTPAQSVESAVAEFKPAFEQALRVRNFYLANLIAMGAAESLFEGDSELARAAAWGGFFAPLARRYRTQYQSYDFETADYQLCPMSGLWSLIRGPKPRSNALAAGQYVTFLGAAQLFGRYRKKAPHAVIGDALGIAGLNLSTGGAGPESYAEGETTRLANHGKAVVLQILSGRSIGCEEYPGARLTLRKTGDVEKVDRLKLLDEIWHRSPDEALRLVRKWQQRYVELMTTLIDRLEVPVVLVWISARSPDEWCTDEIVRKPNFGNFPQLVDREMLDKIAAKCAQVVQITRDPGLPHGFVSRFTGKRCPVFRSNGNPLWKNDYYPSHEGGAELCRSVEAALAAILGGRERMRKRRIGKPVSDNSGLSRTTSDAV